MLSARIRNYFWSMALIAGACLFRPLVFWAENAWDISSPFNVFATSSIAIITGWLLLFALTGFNVRRPIPVSFLIAGLAFIGFNWSMLGTVSPWIWIVLVCAATVVAVVALQDKTLTQISAVALSIVVLAPAVQVVIQHYAYRTPYPLNSLSPPLDTTPTRTVEDVLVLIVDSYPMLTVAEDWFQHDTRQVEKGLSDEGFEVARVAWSHNTFTGLAVPSILQLEQVTDSSLKGSWGNRLPSYDLVRGENFTARTLKEAGYTYTHIEAGWDGAVCGPVVDNCMETVWLDESNWNLFAPSVLGPLFRTHFGSAAVGSTLRTVDHLSGLKVFDDGAHDYVYAHMMLPHHPYVVDDECRVLPPGAHETSTDEYKPLRSQLQCVDSLLLRVGKTVGDRTAVLITGDHGTGPGEPRGSSSDAWTDSQIAERLGVLLAYKLPSECDGPISPTNISVMRSIMRCAVHGEIPSKPAKFMLGADQPIELESERLKDIEDSLIHGDLHHDG